MRGTKRGFVFALVGLALSTGLFGAPAPSMADAGNHVLYINGISTVLKQCQYVWARDANNEPIRDELGIPKPSTLPPTCRDRDPNQAGIQPEPCTLRRNMGPYTPYWRGADATKGEVGIYPPCSGVLTATLLPGEQGCIDVSTSPNATCKLDAPTWFYGYCAQTYGGDSATDGVGGIATIQLAGVPWKIEKLGFTRGRGVWEFGAKIQRLVAPYDRSTMRFYLDALPNKLPDEGTACDGGPTLTSVEFVGTIVIPAPPVKLFRTSPGWHFCADDPMIPGRQQDVDGC
jgi:hypothetical protein